MAFKTFYLPMHYEQCNLQDTQFTKQKNLYENKNLSVA